MGEIGTITLFLAAFVAPFAALGVALGVWWLGSRAWKQQQ